MSETTATEVAEWMFNELRNAGILYQEAQRHGIAMFFLGMDFGHKNEMMAGA